jgi:hypothetical protein
MKKEVIVKNIIKIIKNNVKTHKKSKTLTHNLIKNYFITFLKKNLVL